MSQNMALWEIDKGIKLELFQNVILTSIGVFCLIRIFLTSLRLSLMVQMSITLTVVSYQYEKRT